MGLSLPEGLRKTLVHKHWLPCGPCFRPRVWARKSVAVVHHVETLMAPLRLWQGVLCDIRQLPGLSQASDVTQIIETSHKQASELRAKMQKSQGNHKGPPLANPGAWKRKRNTYINNTVSLHRVQYAFVSDSGLEKAVFTKCFQNYSASYSKIFIR